MLIQHEYDSLKKGTFVNFNVSSLLIMQRLLIGDVQLIGCCLGLNRAALR